MRCEEVLQKDLEGGQQEEGRNTQGLGWILPVHGELSTISCLHSSYPCPAAAGARDSPMGPGRRLCWGLVGLRPSGVLGKQHDVFEDPNCPSISELQTGLSSTATHPKSLSRCPGSSHPLPCSHTRVHPCCSPLHGHGLEQDGTGSLHPCNIQLEHTEAKLHFRTDTAMLSAAAAGSAVGAQRLLPILPGASLGIQGRRRSQLMELQGTGRCPRAPSPVTGCDVRMKLLALRRGARPAPTLPCAGDAEGTQPRAPRAQQQQRPWARLRGCKASPNEVCNPKPVSVSLLRCVELP